MAHSASLFLAEGQLLMAAGHRNRENVGSYPVLKLYDTSSADPEKIQCVFALPRRTRSGDTSVEVHGGDSHSYRHPTFYTRPEDRILTVYVKDGYFTRVASIVVFVSTLLRLAQSRCFVGWQEWKQYAWVADHQEADDLFNRGSFISSSRIIHFSAPPKALEVTTFRPSIIERPLYTSGNASDDSGRAEPRRLTGRKVLSDAQVDDVGKTEVMMSEDNIILMKRVRNSPGGSLPTLILQ